MPKVFEAPPGFVLNPDYLVTELRAQRDALLEALQYMLNVCPAIDAQGEEAHYQGRTAIAKAEGAPE